MKYPKKFKRKLQEVNARLDSMDNKIGEVFLEQQKALVIRELMQKDLTEVKNSILTHMEDEEEHHVNTRQAIESLTVSVGGLIDQQNNYRKIREESEKEKAVQAALADLAKQEKEESEKEIEKSKDFRRGIYSMIIGTVATLLIVAVGSFMWTSMTYYSKAKQTAAVQKAMLANQEIILEKGRR